MTSPNTPVPLVDLGIQHRRVAAEVAQGFDRVLAGTSFVLGPDVEAFEHAYARFCGAADCVGVGNGTDALELALRAVGVRNGDEVLVPANSFVATAGAAARMGARLSFVDCDEDYLIDPADLATRVSQRTRAVLPVHLYGQMAPMGAVRDAVGASVAIIEDAAQSQGASQAGARAGSVGIAAGTSFYPGKNLGAYGDAGAVTTMSPELAERVRRLRNHGGIRRYEHLEEGANSRLDSLQAVVLNAKLAKLQDWNRERAAAAERYTAMLADLPEVITPRVAPDNLHVWHLYVVRVPNRDDVLAAMNADGVGAGIHYPSPLHLLPAFAHLGHGPGSFPVAERLASQIMSLPIYPGITEAQQDRVVAVLGSALRRTAGRVGV